MQRTAMAKQSVDRLPGVRKESPSTMGLFFVQYPKLKHGKMQL